VLFLLRPRQTWMPYGLPRGREQQQVYNDQLHQAYASTRRLPAPAPSEATDVVAQLKDLAALRESGAVTEDEFQALKTKLLASS
jgi:hypothetical protein